MHSINLKKKKATCPQLNRHIYEPLLFVLFTFYSNLQCRSLQCLSSSSAWLWWQECHGASSRADLWQQLARQIHGKGPQAPHQSCALSSFTLAMVQWVPAESLVLSCCNLLRFLLYMWYVTFGSQPCEDFDIYCAGLHQKAAFYIGQWAFCGQSV